MDFNTSDYRKILQLLLAKHDVMDDKISSQVGFKIVHFMNYKNLVEAMKALNSENGSLDRNLSQLVNTFDSIEDPLSMFRKVISGYSVSTIAVIGLVLNIIGIYFFSTGTRRGKILSLMVSTLFAFDAIFLFCKILKNMEEWFVCIGRKHYKTFFTVMNSIMRSSIISSIFMLVAISWVRLCAIRKPFQHNNAILTWNERRNYWLKYCIPIFISSLILTSPVLLEIQDAPLKSSDTDLIVTPTKLRSHPLYSILYVGVLNLGILGLIPIILLMYLANNIRMELSKGKEQRRRLGSVASLDQVGIDQIESSNDRIDRVTRGLVAVVIAFIGFHTLRVLTTIAEIYLVLNQNEENGIFLGGDLPEWFDISISMSELLVVTNASVNVVIYLMPYWKTNEQVRAPLSIGRKHSDRRTLNTHATVEEFILIDVEPCEENKENTEESDKKSDVAKHEINDSVMVHFPKRKSRSLTVEPSFDTLRNEIDQGSKGTIRRRSMLDKIEEAYIIYYI